MAPPEHDTLQALTRESAWLHRLARSLVRDAHRAEDAAQRALLLALQSARRTGPPASPRGWLATLLRNVVREEVRSEGRRRGRESLRGGTREAPGADEALQRLELQQLVVQTIRELDEPYRTAVVLRYLEGLSVRRIARRTEVPVKTVHTRLERARARLRQKLDRQHGGEGARWLSALLALPTNHTAKLATGVGSMGAGAKSVLGTVAVAALLGGGLWWARAAASGSSRPATGAVDGAEAPAATATGRGLGEAARVAEQRAPVAPLPLGHGPAGPASHGLLSGRVESVDGRPLAGARVRLAPGAGPGPRAAVRSGADGAFVLPYDGRSEHLEASLAGYCAWSSPTVAAAETLSDHVIVLAPLVSLGGRVVDEERLPVAGARVRARVRPHDDADVTWLEWTAESGPDGAFTFDDLPLVDDTALLTGEREGYVPAALRVSGLGRADVELVLRSFPEGARVLRGRVLDGAGEAIEGAWVGAASALEFAVAETTDSRGAFTLLLPEEAGPCTVRAVVPGWRPATERIVVDGRRQNDLTLVVDRPAGEVRGVVVDAAGAPVPGARVFAQERTWFATVPMEASGVRLNGLLDLESVARSEPCEADALGRFHLTGLLADEAALIATDDVQLRASAPTTVRAGAEGVRVVLAAEPVFEVRGRVVDALGAPFAGLVVRPTRGLGAQRDVSITAESTVTDAEGRFAFEALCVDGTSLRLSGEDAPTVAAHPLSQQADLGDVRIVVGRTIRLRVETTGSSDADGFRVVDLEGRRLDVVLVTESGLRLQAGSVGLQPNQVQRIEIDERAAHVVFHREQEELGRVPIQRVTGMEARVVWP